MSYYKRMRDNWNFFIPALQLIVILTHRVLGVTHDDIYSNTVLLAISLILGAASMLRVMSENKKRQKKQFLSDSRKEEIMVEKIESSKFHKKIEEAKADDDLSYQEFLNLYFACFKHQPSQQLFIALNWGACLITSVYILFPLISPGSTGGLGVLVLFASLLIVLFSIITYFYSIYLKTKVEADIIEDYVHKHHL